MIETKELTVENFQLEVAILATYRAEVAAAAANVVTMQKKIAAMLALTEMDQKLADAKEALASWEEFAANQKTHAQSLRMCLFDEDQVTKSLFGFRVQASVSMEMDTDLAIEHALITAPGLLVTKPKNMSSFKKHYRGLVESGADASVNEFVTLTETNVAAVSSWKAVDAELKEDEG